MGRVLSLVLEDKEKERKNLFVLNIIRSGKNRISLKGVEEKLKEWGVEYVVKNSNHIKIGAINYYLSTGTCYIDGMGASFKKKGIKFLKEVLKKEGVF